MAVKAVIMAAGQGTRMKSELPKVLHLLAGRPMIQWVVEAARGVGVDQIMVVVGFGAEAVASALPDDVDTCLQSEQLGTGHAVQIAIEALGDVSSHTVLVLSGDTPLLQSDALKALVESNGPDRPAAALLTAEVPDPYGYGRVLRDEQGQVVGIVEHKDATAGQLAINEINAGIYAFDGARLIEGLRSLTNDNSQNEYYLTDVIGYFANQGLAMLGVKTDIGEVAGVNSQAHLADASAVMRRRIAVDWMEHGVWIQDLNLVFISADTVIEPGAQLYAGVQLQGVCHVGAGAQVGPDVFAVDSRIGPRSVVTYSVIRDSAVGADVRVGPYASLRSGVVLEAGSKVGTFVEMKNASLGEGATVAHLSYMGDASIGPDTNIGAGAITCNYDGVDKHRTEIGARVLIGSDTMLVAPVTVGDDAMTGAGSTISRNVSARALAVGRAAQREIAGYADRIDKRRKAKEERS
ncbi:MAG: bifunctional UDP-N-acetylglucosamine diphosphorylase/glucosamine-1-phosphate N-acetyltransferase GlmU [Acidimicrobiia bacterium]|nr:bifunctional UDP-N-acetylglucosamine diphosphorylase/glucosamine-1-phosphate N-acetyltransferase GlmU [Acidimicrobiia bacterium]